MNFKKTFWMNVVLAIFLPYIFLVSYATDIDFVYRTMAQRAFTISTQLFIFCIPIITAICLWKSNIPMLRKLAFIGNYLTIIGTIFYLVVAIYRFPKQYIDEVFLFILFGYFIFLVPFVINLKMLKEF